MTQKDTELIIDAIDFYNLNHFRGKETKKQLNKAKAKLEALNTHNVSKSVAKQYAEFCVRCDREGLPLLELDDYIKQYCC